MAMMRWQAGEGLARIRVPALVFTGTRDLVTLPSAGETIAAQIPGARLEPMGGAGHLGPLEMAEDYAQRIAAFADEVFTRGAVSADLRSRPRQTPQDDRPELRDGGRPFA